MEKKEFCQLAKKLEGDEKLTSQEIKQIMQIVRSQINFMIKNNITMSPKNYERWFYVFCHIIENNKELNDLEILGLFKEFYDAPYDEIKEKSEDENNSNSFKQKGVVKKLATIADLIGNKLEEIILIVDNYNENINIHQQHIQAESDNFDQELKNHITKILSELEALRKENSKLTDELKQYHKEVIKLQNELVTAKVEAEIDFLTGLVNRRRFERAVSDLINEYQKKNYPFALILLDIDNFKQINDTYGHPVGDLVLKEIALILKTFLRANNIAARIGGEEFAVLVPGVGTSEAYTIAERLREAIANRSISTPEGEIKITASFGVTAVKETDSVETIFNRADQALYEAKRSGKNRVVVVE